MSRLADGRCHYSAFLTERGTFEHGASTLVAGSAVYSAAKGGVIAFMKTGDPTKTA